MPAVALSGWPFADLLLGFAVIFLADSRPPIPKVTNPTEELVIEAEVTPEEPESESLRSEVELVRCEQGIGREPVSVRLSGLDAQGRRPGGTVEAVLGQVKDALRARFEEAEAATVRGGMALTFGNIWSPSGRDYNYGVILAQKINDQIDDEPFFRDSAFRAYLHDGLPPGTAEMEIFLLLCRRTVN